MLTDAQCRAAKPKEGIYRLNDYKGLVRPRFSRQLIGLL